MRREARGRNSPDGDARRRGGPPAQERARIEAARVFDARRQEVGWVEPDGTIYRLGGIVIGYVVRDGRVFGASLRRLGAVSRKGEIFDASDQPVGYVEPAGDVYSRADMYAGAVEVGVTPAVMGGAALLLLLDLA